MASAANAGTAAAATMCDVNAERRANGLRPLRWNWRLGVAAQRLASDMQARGYFGHITPDGKDLTARVAATGYAASAGGWSLAENIAWADGALATPDATIEGWLTSPPHRQNLLNPRFREVGIGVALGSPVPGLAPGAFFVADFGTKARQRHRHRRHRIRR